MRIFWTDWGNGWKACSILAGRFGIGWWYQVPAAAEFWHWYNGPRGMNLRAWRFGFTMLSHEAYVDWMATAPDPKI